MFPLTLHALYFALWLYHSAALYCSLWFLHSAVLYCTLWFLCGSYCVYFTAPL